MGYCAWVASNAHVEVMRQACPGMIEYELEAIFAYEIAEAAAESVPTPPSVAAARMAPLHYGHAGAPNDRVIKETDMRRSTWVLVPWICQ